MVELACNFFIPQFWQVENWKSLDGFKPMLGNVEVVCVSQINCRIAHSVGYPQVGERKVSFIKIEIVHKF